MDTFTIECRCGVIHEDVPQRGTKVVCGCGREITGVFGLQAQIEYQKAIDKFLTNMNKAYLSGVTTEQLVDELARRIKEGEV